MYCSASMPPLCRVGAHATTRATQRFASTAVRSRKSARASPNVSGWSGHVASRRHISARAAAHALLPGSRVLAPRTCEAQTAGWRAHVAPMCASSRTHQVLDRHFDGTFASICLWLASQNAYENQSLQVNDVTTGRLASGRHRACFDTFSLASRSLATPWLPSHARFIRPIVRRPCAEPRQVCARVGVVTSARHPRSFFARTPCECSGASRKISHLLRLAPSRSHHAELH